MRIEINILNQIANHLDQKLKYQYIKNKSININEDKGCNLLK